MTLLRCCLFAGYIALAAGAWAQATPSRQNDERAGVKARLSLLSQVSSKSPSGSSFMAKIEDPVEVQGKPVLPAGRWWKDIWKQRRRGVRCGEARCA